MHAVMERSLSPVRPVFVDVESDVGRLRSSRIMPVFPFFEVDPVSDPVPADAALRQVQIRSHMVA